MLRPKRLLLSIIITFVTAIAANAQTFAVKTNALYWLAGATFNAGIEKAVSDKVSIELDGAYNPWTFKDDKKMRLWMLQPEIKVWTCEKFEGAFWGIHAIGGQYFGGFHSKRYDGYMAGGGISYGYDWLLSLHWNIEMELGLGFLRMWYKESDRLPCYTCQQKKHKSYVGPTKAAISVVYTF